MLSVVCLVRQQRKRRQPICTTIGPFGRSIDRRQATKRPLLSLLAFLPWGEKAHDGVREFFEVASRDAIPLYLSVVTVGELRTGVERLRHRGDIKQADLLERWLRQVTQSYADAILPFDEETAHDLTVVTRNTGHFAPTGVRLKNPFE